MIRRFIHSTLGVPYKLHIRDIRKVPRPRATVLFIHGIGSSGAEWQDVIRRLPGDVSIVTIDLLGFGSSPRPEWAKYDANEQAKAVIATLLGRRIATRLIVVGHSLGALVAVEVAKKYPLLVRSLVLCSPPFYAPQTEGAPMLSPEKFLNSFYAKVEHNQDYFIKMANLAMKYKLVNPAFSLSRETFPSYIQTLKAAIMNQSAYDDVRTIQRPITIVYGSFDPFVIDKNIKRIAADNPQVRLSKILVGHEIIGRFVPAVTRVITQHIDEVHKQKVKS